MIDPILVDRCAFYPGHAIDGSQPGPGEGVVDTHIELPGDLHVYIGRRLGRAVGSLFGMVDQADLIEAQRENRAQALKLANAEGELAELRPIADSIARFADRHGVEV